MFFTQDSEFRSFFGRIEETIILFRDCLTFISHLKIGTLLHFGFHLGTMFLCHFFYKKLTKNPYGGKLIFSSFATFFGQTIFRSGAKQKFVFTESLNPSQSWTKIQELTIQTSLG